MGFFVGLRWVAFPCAQENVISVSVHVRCGLVVKDFIWREGVSGISQQLPKKTGLRFFYS